MAEITEDKILDIVKGIKEVFADGFQFADIAYLVQAASEFAEVFTLSGAEKKALAVRVINKVIDETDTPWLPDALVDPLLKQVIPGLIDLLVSATKGKLKINAPAGATEG